MSTAKHRSAPGPSCFVTTERHQNRQTFQIAEVARIPVQTLFHCRDQNAYLLHEFAALPDHLQKSNSAGITAASRAEALLAPTAAPGLKEAPAEQELQVSSAKIMRNSTCGRGLLE